MLPTQVAVIHRRRVTDEISRGNHKADKQAREAAQLSIQAALSPTFTPMTPQYTEEEIQEETNMEFTFIPEKWLKSPKDKLLLPRALQWKVLQNLQQSTHFGAKALQDLLQPLLVEKGISQTLCDLSCACATCCLVNNEGNVKPPLLLHPVQRRSTSPTRRQTNRLHPYAPM